MKVKMLVGFLVLSGAASAFAADSKVSTKKDSKASQQANCTQSCSEAAPDVPVYYDSFEVIAGTVSGGYGDPGEAGSGG